MTRLLIFPILVLLLLFVSVITLIHTQTYDDHTIRTILLPTDCNSPCFMGIRPGVTYLSDAYALLEANPWVGDITSHIDSGCCTIALNWKWNGKQPANLGSTDNIVYMSYNPVTGTQVVQNIALHTEMATNYAILVLGAWGDSGALRGTNSAYVDLFYRQYWVHVTMNVSCPLTRWRLWQAPMTLALSLNSRGVSGMKHMNEIC